MREIIFSVALALSAISFVVNAEVSSFEDLGVVQSVQLGNNLIGVNDLFYSLPNNVVIDEGAAILALKPGYLIGFSGSRTAPYNRIDSLYLFPESVINAEQNLKNVTDTTEEGGAP